MPLELRVIAPICVSRNTLSLFVDSQHNPISIPNELECVTNGTLANIIRQLASLSRNADDIFSGLIVEANNLITKSTTLQGRIDRLSTRVTQLDSSLEEVSLQDIHLRKPFKSSVSYDQQVLSRATMPLSIKEMYISCDKPPPLNELNPFREDGEDALKFYTHPGYFIDLWRKQMLRETEKEKSNRKGGHRQQGKGPSVGQDKRRQKKPRQPANTWEKFRAIAAQQEFIDENHVAKINGQVVNSNGVVVYGNQYTVRPNSLELNQYVVDYPTQHNAPVQQIHGNGPAYVPVKVSDDPPPYYTLQDNVNISSQGTPTRKSVTMNASRPSQPPPAPPSNPPSSSSSTGTPTVGTPRSRGASLTRDSLPPPPPPPDENEPLPPPAQPMSPKGYIPEKHCTNMIIPPPPPPPPEGLLDTVDKESKNGIIEQSILVQNKKEEKPKGVKMGPPSDLLAAIKEGIQLRRVERSNQRVIEKTAPLYDVASILARRRVIDPSDSDSDGSNESGSGSGWDDESEC